MLLEETDCTEEEMMVFAALQVSGGLGDPGRGWVLAGPRAGRVFRGGGPISGKPHLGHCGPPTQPSLAACPSQYHINKLSQSGEVGEPTGTDPGLDDLDAALNNLEVKLEGSAATDVLVRRGSGQGLGLGSGSRART